VKDVQFVSGSVRLTDTFRFPTANLVDDIGWTFNGTEAVSEGVSERVDHHAFSIDLRLQPLVQRGAGAV
jgi:hypothetical protein